MPSMKEATRVWARIAALSFGGPAGQIAVMHRILVDEEKWISEARFLHALNYCMLLPGPEAQQLATYIGWLLHKTKGGLIAGTLFVLPGFVTIMALSWLYAAFGQLPIVEALFFGLKAAVLAIVLEAVRRIGKRALKSRLSIGLAVASFVAIFVFGVPFPLIILAAALVGWVMTRFGGADMGTIGHEEPTALGDAVPDHARNGIRSTIAVSAVFLLLWICPVVALLAMLGPQNPFSQIATFFSKMAVVTFGGAYAVLAYVAQEAVGTYHWLRPGEMLDGLAMAETTPGPLIMVLQFVGFMAAFRQASGMDPFLAATLGGILATWVTFTPCFLWIFAGAPYAERLRGNPALAAALGAITAAVVGVIVNLAAWFALHFLFQSVQPVHWGPLRVDLPVLASVDWAAVLLTAAAVVAVLRFRIGTVVVLALSGAAGVAYRLLVA